MLGSRTKIDHLVLWESDGCSKQAVGTWALVEAPGDKQALQPLPYGHQSQLAGEIRIPVPENVPRNGSDSNKGSNEF